MPVEVVGITDATAITAGVWHSCALHQDGTISCWGDNGRGQLGNATYTDSAVPVEVAGITDATAITTGGTLGGGWHSCALHQDGTISCWGDNEYGQLGNGTDTRSSVPVGVVGITDATAIAAGWFFSCALHEGGTISCWGRNNHGQLGNEESGDESEFSEPVKVEGITDATAITTGDEHSCALHEGSTISCWGNNFWGQLGNGTTDDSSVPVEAADITDATAIAAGENHSCALHQTGAISCWGHNRQGQLGNGTNVISSVPVETAGITDATAITTGSRHSCALHQTGAISCWGHNEYGQLGNETDTISLVPVGVVGITDATAITTGGLHSCALHQDGTISCWGDNTYGQLGNEESGDESEFSEPVKVEGITDATAITTGGGHSCALHQDGTIFCWGHNEDGQLGNGTTDDSSVPVEAASITDATAITAGVWHSCALHQDGAISCWGDNTYGQLGNGQNTGDLEDDSADSSMPVKVAGITNATAITAGLWHSCALHQDGTISCWGYNEDGQLGNGQHGDDANSSIPVEAAGITDATAITAGVWHSCALHQDGTISCWGHNLWGQLGDGSRLPQFVVGFGG